MEMLMLVLLLAIAVLVSAVIDQVVPKVSLPLIQVAMGVVIALFFKGYVEVELEPDLFLVLFIAPLLYLEAKDADKALLWRNKSSIFSLAIGLVVVTMIAIGFTLNALVPSVSIAAALALGAALGPTDAVAVASLSKQVNIPERLWGVLKGELLLNDASGIVSFQFAIAAATTGAFSIMEAGEDFLVEFIGGLIVGLILGYLANYILRKIRDIGLESTTFHVLYEICIPFVVYLTSQAVHVSGIIAVVVAGLVNVIAPRTVSPKIAQMNIVSTNVWNVISFTLNGIVFILLGTQIPSAMVYSWQDHNIDNVTLITLVVVLTAVLMGVRFIWCALMELYHSKRSKNGASKKVILKNAAILAFCGAKGTITLSILFTIPVFFATTGSRFPERNLLIFLGCGVILCTLLIATFIVPLVAPKRERKQTELEARQNYFECLTDILRNVIEELTSQITRENRRAVKTVILAYQDRIENAKEEISDDDEDRVTEIRLQTVQWEIEKTLVMIEAGSVDADVGYEYLGRLERVEQLLKHQHDHDFFRRLLGVLRGFQIHAKSMFYKVFPKAKKPEKLDEMRKLQIECTLYVINKLNETIAQDSLRTEDVSKVLMIYETTLMSLRQKTPSLTNAFELVDQTDDIKRLAYQIELEQIQKMHESERISRQEARNMRENVYLMQMDLEDKF